MRGLFDHDSARETFDREQAAQCDTDDWFANACDKFEEYAPPPLDADAQEAFNRLCQRAPPTSLDEWLKSPSDVKQLDERKRAHLYDIACADKGYRAIILADTGIDPAQYDRITKRKAILSRMWPADDPLDEEPPF